MNTKLSLAVALTVFSSASFAESANSMSDEFESLKQKLHSVSPTLRQVDMSVDEINSNEEFRSGLGKDYMAVVLQGKRLLVRKNGQEIVEPSGLYIAGKTGLERASSNLVKIDMKQSAGKWPSLPVPEGVDKTGDLYVLSDPTCGYCHKIEEEAERYLMSGIEIHYIPYPRSGVSDINAAGMSRWAAAACADNPGQAYHEISLGNLDKYEVPTDINQKCIDVVRDGYAFGQRIGISGTPFMYAESVSGHTFTQGGYVSVDNVGPSIGIMIKSDGGELLLK